MISDDDKARAEKIARLVIETNTDTRGEVLLEVAGILRNNGQGFTASVFQFAAVRYGFER